MTVLKETSRLLEFYRASRHKRYGVPSLYVCLFFYIDSKYIQNLKVSCVYVGMCFCTDTWWTWAALSPCVICWQWWTQRLFRLLLMGWRTSWGWASRRPSRRTVALELILTAASLKKPMVRPWCPHKHVDCTFYICRRWTVKELWTRMRWHYPLGKHYFVLINMISGNCFDSVVFVKSVWNICWINSRLGKHEI